MENEINELVDKVLKELEEERKFKKEKELKDEHNDYCVYMHTNLINGKKYIGQTCKLPKYRWVAMAEDIIGKLISIMIFNYMAGVILSIKLLRII